ncbi:thioesterase family protein [Streptomyces aidingensis]|uniref:Thioesterase-like superfamily protein n=1 Tax=Streptomyces aidingensis TaxID=910347 RepID=A0A1I1NKY6_9ACTN|nr:thioesterase family protein [Streptomyces aidingensis]SFC98076.1 Thioesterase-like superfamily protein [Streptomyces aidingensis]
MPAASAAAGPGERERESEFESEFDRDTALTLKEPGVYHAEVSGGWSIVSAVNGGYLTAMLGRALAGTLPHPHPFTVTAHFLTATRPGPAVIRTSVARTGTTLSTGSASLHQTDEHGRETERIRLLGTYGDLTRLSDSVRTSAKPPVLPPPEQCVPVADAPDGALPGDLTMLDRLAARLDPDTVGWALGRPSGRGEVRGWFALADGRELDPLALLLVGDALPPTAFDLGLAGGWVPTIEYTTHVRALPAPGPVRVAISTRNLAGGFLEEDAEIWDSADRLVAQSRQLARAPRG